MTKFDATGAVTERTSLYDNGRVLTTIYENGIRTEHVETKADGDIVTTIYGPDVARDSVVFQDISETRDWASYTRTYDTAGEVISTNYEWDVA